MNRKPALLFSVLLTLILFINIYFLSHENKIERKQVIISRVIDGDTLVTEDGITLRLLNINTPEKGKPGYEYSISYLSQFINNSLKIEDLGAEKYGRTLARIYNSEDYINLELVKKGYAIKFLVDEKEKKLFEEAERTAIENSVGMWKKSQHYGCIEAEVKPEEEIIKLKNNCNEINLKDWIIKDESRKEYKFPDIYLIELQFHTLNGTNNQTDLFWKSNQHVWNDDRDTIYIFDKEQKIAYHRSYGY